MSFTVSLVTQPFEYTTVNAVNNSNTYYQLESTNAGAPSFQYFFDVYQYDLFTGATMAFIGEFDAPPRPISGDGIFPVGRPLQSYINNEPTEFNVQLQGIQSVSQSIVRYGTKYGFEYNPGFTFSTFDFTFILQFLGLSFSSAVDIKVGDQLTLLMASNQFNPQYNGVTTVVGTGSTGSSFFALTSEFYGTTPSIPEYGTITNLKRITGSTSNNYWGWNGTRQYTEEGVDFFNEFVLTGSSNDQFLTNYLSYEYFGPGAPTFSVKPVFLNQYETIGFISDPAHVINEINIVTFDAYGNQLSNTTHGATGINYPYRKYELGIGPQNLTDAYGTSFTGVFYYEVFLVNSSGFINQGQILRRIDYECQRCFYKNYQITWLNPRGSYEYWNFNLDSQRTVNNTVVEYKKVLPWNYAIGARERTVLSQEAQAGYQINTNWITEHDYAFLESLTYGAEAYSIENGKRIPIIITDRTYQTKTYARDQIFNLTINFEYATLINTQNN